MPGGQGEETKPTKPAPGLEDETAETRAIERRAKEERPTPKDEARKTEAEGAAERTKVSAPGAHPTATGRPAASTEETTRETRRSEAGPQSEREPQKPTMLTRTTTFRLEGNSFATSPTELGRAVSLTSPKGERSAPGQGRGALYAATRLATERSDPAGIGLPESHTYRREPRFRSGWRATGPSAAWLGCARWRASCSGAVTLELAEASAPHPAYFRLVFLRRRSAGRGPRRLRSNPLGRLQAAGGVDARAYDKYSDILVGSL